MYEKMFDDDFYIPDTREYLDCLGYYYDLILDSAPALEPEPDEELLIYAKKIESSD